MRGIKIFAVGAIALSLAACAEGGQKENVGTVLGGIGGAVLGSQFGGGRGQLVGVAVGTLAGAFLGREVGKSLDKADQAHMQRAETAAQTAPVGQRISWSNPDSGNSGTVTPTREGRDQAGNQCREYQTTVTVGGKQEQAYGTACRQQDGSWKVVN
ncbi:MAG: glycine zipper 2TM domain-containing protein [Alphaproteobacteria bacterium]|nr:glycine zipper 2TM domain-containing protein [Alphaproteobacteria bacterium]MBN9496385.1 glycine zipper 2TM domain-containing protein [Alphaproteobacteria bacterium]